MDPSELIRLLKENSQFLFILGIVVITTSLILHLRKRQRAEAERQARRRAEIKAAQEAERKRQVQRGEKVKSNPTTSPDRMPLTDPYDATFTGSASPKNLAKWEAEIHQIGRQMIGQIDSKMVALQVLTLEANRVANRLEILVDHLENLVVPHSPGDLPAENYQENKTNKPNAISENPEIHSTEHVPRLISAAPSESIAEPVRMEAFADILDDLESELDQFHEESTRWKAEPVEQVLPATIIKASDFSEKEISQSWNSQPLPSSIPSSLSNPLSLSSPRLPGDLFADLPSNIRHKTERKTVSAESLLEPTRQTTSRSKSNALSIDSLYEGRSNPNTGKPLPPGGLFDEKPLTGKGGSRLALRKQVEMLADYGYTANQIAQNLNITVGEVDLMLSLRN